MLCKCKMVFEAKEDAVEWAVVIHSRVVSKAMQTHLQQQ